MPLLSSDDQAQRLGATMATPNWSFDFYENYTDVLTRIKGYHPRDVFILAHNGYRVFVNTGFKQVGAEWDAYFPDSYGQVQAFLNGLDENGLWAKVANGEGGYRVFYVKNTAVLSTPPQPA
jgi:hypothetical protein